MLRANAIAGAIALVGCCAPGSATAVAAGGGCAQPASTADTTTLKRASDDVLCLVNGERTTRGLAPLRVSRLLAGSAQSHSRDMVARRYFSHVSPGGMNARQRILRSGYLRKRPATHVGEAIAWGIAHRGTPAGLVRSFMNSPGHRRIVLDRRHRAVGVGLVRGAPLAGRGRGSTLTLDFGQR